MRRRNGKSDRARGVRGLACAGVLPAVVGGPAGCGMMADGLVAVREEAQRTRDAIEADRDALAREAERFPDGSEDRARIEGLIADRSVQADAFARAIQRIEAARAQAAAAGDDPAGTLEQGAAWLAPLVPPGAQLPLVLGAGLAASVWRAVRLKQSAASIAEGLEKAMRGDEALREGVKRNAAIIRSVQTRAAQRIVDEVQKSKAMVRLPI